MFLLHSNGVLVSGKALFSFPLGLWKWKQYNNNSSLYQACMARKKKKKRAVRGPVASLYGKEEEEGQSEGLHQACTARKKRRGDLERVARMFQKR